MSCLPLPGSQSFPRHLCFQSVWAKEKVFYTICLDGVEKAGPATGSAGLKVLSFQLGEGLGEWCPTLETPALCVFASPPSLLIPISPCLTLGLETNDQLCRELMGWDGTRLGWDRECAVITVPFYSLWDVGESREHWGGMGS